MQSRERFIRGWEEGFKPAPARMLAVAGGGYRGLLGAREWLYGRGLLKSRALPCRVVSIGNLTVGGTGKTPAVEVAVQTLVALGHRPAVGRHLRQYIRVALGGPRFFHSARLIECRWLGNGLVLPISCVRRGRGRWSPPRS